jgi:hypothetical protein
MGVGLDAGHRPHDEAALKQIVPLSGDIGGWGPSWLGRPPSGILPLRGFLANRDTRSRLETSQNPFPLRPILL